MSAWSISGLVPFNDVISPSIVLGVSPGIARDKDDETDIALERAILKRIDTAWEPGSGAGGLDTGTVQPFLCYHVHAIRNPISGATDVLFSTSPTAPVMPTGFTQRRRVGILQTTTGGAILAGSWRADGSFEYKNAFVVVNNQALSAPVLAPVLASAGIKRKFKGIFLPTRAVGSTFNLIARDPDLGIPDANSGALMTKPGEVASIGQTCEVWTDTAARIYIASSGNNAADAVYITALGWIDLRDEYA